MILRLFASEKGLEKFTNHTLFRLLFFLYWYHLLIRNHILMLNKPVSTLLLTDWNKSIGLLPLWFGCFIIFKYALVFVRLKLFFHIWEIHLWLISHLCTLLIVKNIGQWLDAFFFFIREWYLFLIDILILLVLLFRHHVWKWNTNSVRGWIIVRIGRQCIDICVHFHQYLISQSLVPVLKFKHPLF